MKYLHYKKCNNEIITSGKFQNYHFANLAIKEQKKNVYDRTTLLCTYRQHHIRMYKYTK